MSARPPYCRQNGCHGHRLDCLLQVNSREDIHDLLQLKDNIDLVIPRGSKELVTKIQQESQGIPVLGHSEGVCHVYVDRECDRDMALSISEYSSTQYILYLSPSLLLYIEIHGEAIALPPFPM